MSSIVSNVAKGRVVELVSRVKLQDPLDSVLIVVPLEEDGIEPDEILRDRDTLAALLSGTTREQLVMGRRTITDAALTKTLKPDHAFSRFEAALPPVRWNQAAGNPIAKMAICYSPNIASNDAEVVPMVMLDVSIAPDGKNGIELVGGVFFRAY